LESFVERLEIAQCSNDPPVRRRVRVGPHSAHRCCGSRELSPNPAKGDEEELFIRVVKPRELHTFGYTDRALPGCVCLSETRVGNVFTVGELRISLASVSLYDTHVSVDVDLVAGFVVHVVLAVLLGDALRALFEGLDGGVCPPFAETTLIVVLATRVIKCVSQLVSRDSAKRSVFHV